MWPPPVDKEKNAEWWSNYWNQNFTKGFGEPSMSLINSITVPKHNAKAIDIASGNGRYAFVLEKMGYKTTAIELSASGAERIKNKARVLSSNMEVIQADFIERHEEINNFDITFCSGLLEEIPVNYHKAVITGLSNWTIKGGISINRYCLEIEGRGVLVMDDTILKLYESDRWEIIEFTENKNLKMSKGGFNLRHGTIVARKK